MDSALRACPVCRQVSYYIIPAATWPRTPEEKEEMLSAYKAKLKTIDCKHFDEGRGTCPFGTSCFYRHAYPDGREETPDLRRAEGTDGVRVMVPVRLSDFVSPALSRRRR